MELLAEFSHAGRLLPLAIFALVAFQIATGLFVESNGHLSNLRRENPVRFWVSVLFQFVVAVVFWCQFSA